MEELDEALPKEVCIVLVCVTDWSRKITSINQKRRHSNLLLFHIVTVSPFSPIQEDDLDLESFGKKKKKKKRAGEGMAIDDAADDNKENGRIHYHCSAGALFMLSKLVRLLITIKSNKCTLTH